MTNIIKCDNLQCLCPDDFCSKCKELEKEKICDTENQPIKEQTTEYLNIPQ